MFTEIEIQKSLDLLPLLLYWNNSIKGSGASMAFAAIQSVQWQFIHQKLKRWSKQSQDENLKVIPLKKILSIVFSNFVNTLPIMRVSWAEFYKSWL